MPSITIDRRRGTLFYLFLSTSSEGMGLIHGDPVMISAKSSLLLKGETALQVLSQSPEFIPHITGTEQLKSMARLAATAGVKSWGTYLRGRSTVQITRKDGTLSIRWFKKSGHQGGSSSERDWFINLNEHATPEEIGAGIDQAFENCK